VSDFEPDPQLVVDVVRAAQDCGTGIPVFVGDVSLADAADDALPHAEALAARIAQLEAERDGWKEGAFIASRRIEQLEADRRVPVLVGNPEVNAYARKLEAVVEAAKALRGGLSTGAGQQVYITGDHYYFTVETFDRALAALREDKPRPSPWTEPADHVRKDNTDA
jgi:hypothetical protein